VQIFFVFFGQTAAQSGSFKILAKLDDLRCQQCNEHLASVFAGFLPLACIAHKSCERCRLWQRNSPATPENSAAFWSEEFKDNLFRFIYFEAGS
jgi:hypothetical protein